MILDPGRPQMFGNQIKELNKKWTEPCFLEKVKRRAGDAWRLGAEGDGVRRRAKIQVHVLTLKHANRKSFDLPKPWLFQLRNDSLLHEAIKRPWGGQTAWGKQGSGCQRNGDLNLSPTIN